MALTINEVYAKEIKSSFPGWRRTFYLSRILRLYPAYLTTLAFTVLWFGLNGTSNVFIYRPAMPLADLLGLQFLNVFLVGQDFFKAILYSPGLAKVNPVIHVIAGAMPPNFFQNK